METSRFGLSILTSILVSTLVSTSVFANASASESTAQSQNDIDIRLLAPSKPAHPKPTLAAPRSGDSLGSVGADWARRQIHLSTDGADEAFLAETNERLDRFFGFTDLPADLPTDFPADTSMGTDRPASPNRAPASALKPRSLHMPKLGEFELAFGSNTKLHCDLVNGNELTLSKPIFQDIDLRLHHENTLNSVQLKFDW